MTTLTANDDTFIHTSIQYLKDIQNTLSDKDKFNKMVVFYDYLDKNRLWLNDEKYINVVKSIKMRLYETIEYGSANYYKKYMRMFGFKFCYMQNKNGKACRSTHIKIINSNIRGLNAKNTKNTNAKNAHYTNIQLCGTHVKYYKKIMRKLRVYFYTDICRLIMSFKHM